MGGTIGYCRGSWDALIVSQFEKEGIMGAPWCMMA